MTSAFNLLLCAKLADFLPPQFRHHMYSVLQKYLGIDSSSDLPPKLFCRPGQELHLEFLYRSSKKLNDTNLICLSC